MLFAIEISDLASGGWAGASLLAGVLGWLLWVHLPAKDKQLEKLIEIHAASEKELRETHETAITSLGESHQAVIKSLVAGFKSEIAEERKAGETRISRMDSVITGMLDFMRSRAEDAAKRKGVVT